MKVSRGLAALAAAAVVGALLPAVASDAAVPTCQGHRATIVGHPDPNGSLQGTPGDDVIVTRGVGEVRSGSGSDRICVTGTNSEGYHYIDAGPGDDRVVVATSRPDRVSGVLGAGDDVFRGGPGVDFVYGEAWTTGDVEGRDRIDTGAGADQVRIGLAGATTRDLVDLGPGDDRLGVSGLLAPDVRPTGRGGSDIMQITPELPGHDWVIDNRLGAASVDGVREGRWAGFERFDLTWLDAATLDFIGGAADESVLTSTVLRAATMGGGDDSLWMSGLPDDHLVDVSGGPGRDAFGAEAYRMVAIDLRIGAWGSGGSASDLDVRLNGIEEAEAVSTTVRLDGDAGDNVLEAHGCDVVARGGAGADLVRRTGASATLCDGDVPGVTFHGGPGPDVLVGGAGADQLFGDRGRDRADGRRGADLCLAEITHSCER